MRKILCLAAFFLIAPSIVVVQPTVLSWPVDTPKNKKSEKIPDAAVIESGSKRPSTRCGQKNPCRSSFSRKYTLPARLLEYSVVTYATEDLSRLQENFILRAPRIQRGRIGIGVCSTDDEGQERLYVVTIIH